MTEREMVGPRTSRWSGKVPRIAAALAVGLAVAFVAWLVLRDSGPDSPPRAPAIAMDLAQLRAFASSANRPIYWAGPTPAGLPRAGITYEVTQTGDGSVYIRYLPPGVSAGSDRPQFLTVGTYLDARARATIRQAQARGGATLSTAPGGGTAVSNSARPQSVYFAAPSGRLLIETFDPDPARARRIASTVRPIR
jgi:hypothetical protein